MTIVTLQVLNGLTIGAIYILLASGLTIVFGLQGIVNIAHGVFYMLGAYLAIGLYPRIGFAATLLVVFLATALLGLALELGGVRPLVRWKRQGMQVLVVTLGVAIIASEVTKLVWGPVPQLSDVPAGLTGVMVLGPVVYPTYWLFVIAFTAVFMGLLALAFYRTTLGILVQSIALNSEISQAMGTNAPRINSLVFALGTGVAGVAGVLAGPILSVYPTMCFDLLIILFVVVILGGLGSLLGIVVSGVLIGLVNAFGVAYLTGTVGNIFAFAVMIGVLVFRPLGLFGRAGILK
jgi:branched-subunit amino acid ABC-type transport system permease component